MPTLSPMTTSQNPYTAFSLGGKAVEPVIALASQQKTPVTGVAKTGDVVTISQAARDALAASEADAASLMAARLAEIKAKDPLQRSVEEVAYMQTHDPKLAAILAQERAELGALTAQRMAFNQKTVGFFNSFASASKVNPEPAFS